MPPRENHTLLESFLFAEVIPCAPDDFKRKLTAVFSADAAGYSRLMGEDEAETVRTLTAYLLVQGPSQPQGRIRLRAAQGRVLKSYST